MGTLCDRKAFILQLKTAECLLKKGYSNFKWTIVVSGIYPDNTIIGGIPAKIIKNI